MLVIIRLESWCKRSAACIVRSRPMCYSQYSGVRPSRRADSGAPIYSIIRGSCKCIPYEGSKSSRFARSSYDVIRYLHPDMLSNTIGDCPGSWSASHASKGPYLDRSGPASSVTTHSAAAGEPIVTGVLSVSHEFRGSDGGLFSATIGAVGGVTASGGSGSCNDRR